MLIAMLFITFCCVFFPSVEHKEQEDTYREPSLGSIVYSFAVWPIINPGCITDNKQHGKQQYAYKSDHPFHFVSIV